ncbi:MAG: complement C1q domain-containing protein [Bacteroidales bacterium]|nr:complement C1q domain-containing protein [Bacteroidales bacterium]
MKRIISCGLTALVLLFAAGKAGWSQGTVPGGINYQAVARDNTGKELVNTRIEVRFTIKSGSPTGTIVYQEVFTNVTTTKYGVFSLVIGDGAPVTGTFGAIDWSSFDHYLQVEVKFENLFMDMGTMQFMAVPYALYAWRSLEPGPQGPPGPQGIPGDPATDDQKLAYNIETKALTIDNGNTVRLDSIVAFRARKNISESTSINTNVIMTYATPDLNVGEGLNPNTGIFTAPADGIYTFNITYHADGSGGSRAVSLYVKSALYEIIADEIGAGTTIRVRSVTTKLNKGDTVSVVIFTGISTQTGTGSFAGYKVN